MPPAPVTDDEKRERIRVGTTLKTIRKIRGWSTDGFSQELGIAYSYLSNIEAGRRPLTDPLLARAAEILRVEQIAITHPRVEHGTPTEAVPA